MKKIFLLFSIVALSVFECAASVEVGKPAPGFKAVDSNGEKVSLKDFQGKLVVLEWHNHQCPFVVKHYKSRNMQSLQKKYTNKEVVWLSIISSAQGKQGYVTGDEANANMKDRGAVPTHVLLDPEGDIGRLYNAKTTPEMFVIDEKGIVRYMGAIDSIASADRDDIADAKNYVANALDAVMAGKQVEVASSKPYGCSVKYSSGWKKPGKKRWWKFW